MFNQVMIIGNLTKDWDIKNLPNGSLLAKNSIATSHKYKTQTGEKKEEVCFIDITVFGNGANIVSQYTRKGSKLFCLGRLAFEQWQAQDGSNRSRHALIVSEFKFLDSKGAETPPMQQHQGGHNQQNQQMQQNPQYQQNVQGGQQMMDNHNNIPTIDIHSDEIPH